MTSAFGVAAGSSMVVLAPGIAQIDDQHEFLNFSKRRPTGAFFFVLKSAIKRRSAA